MDHQIAIAKIAMHQHPLGKGRGLGLQIDEGRFNNGSLSPAAAINGLIFFKLG